MTSIQGRIVSIVVGLFLATNCSEPDPAEPDPAEPDAGRTDATFRLTVTLDGIGEGTVISNPAGINCGDLCSLNVTAGQSVMLSATPAMGSEFAGWSGACTGTDSCSVPMNQATTVVARFEPSAVPSYSLSVIRTGAGSGAITSMPSGINCGSACAAQFTSGTVVTLHAAPSTDSTFAGWSGACAGTGSCSVAMTAATSVTALFEKSGEESYLLSVSKAGGGTGTVTSDPPGLDCGTTCAAYVTAGASVRLIATPTANSTFAGWSGMCSGSADCVVTMDDTASVTATFEPVSTDHLLTVSRSGDGEGLVTSDPAGIDCGSACEAAGPEGLVVTLTATPSADSVFVGWSGDCNGGGTCTLTMDAAKSVTATFNVASTYYPLTIDTNGSGGGVVVSDPPGIDCGAICEADAAAGLVVTLIATPDINSTFSGWSGDCGGVGTCTLTMDSAKSVTATFAPLEASHLISVELAGTGTGTVTSDPAGINCGTDCEASGPAGLIVTLTATPNGGAAFEGWTGACTGTGPCAVTLSSDIYVTATFSTAETFYTLTVDRSGSGSGTVSSSPAGIDCGATCSATVASGTMVSLTATPGSSSSFAGWSGACSGTGTCTITMSSSEAVTATFQPVWSIDTVESSSMYGGRHVSLALDATGAAHISHYDWINQNLLYSHWTGTAWSTAVVDSLGTVGEYSSIAVDAAGNPHISYYNRDSKSLLYARWTGSSWAKQAVDYGSTAGKYSSIDLDSSGTPHISYHASDDDSLKYARKQTSGWTVETVDPGPGYATVGWYSSIVVDASDVPHISYYRSGASDLKYATRSGGTWDVSTVDSAGSVGFYTSIAIDGFGSPAISYVSDTDSTVRLARRTAGGWSYETVATNSGLSTSLAFDSTGAPHVSYQRNDNLNHATKVGDAWQRSVVDSSGETGGYSSIAIDAAGKPHIAYSNNTTFQLQYAEQ